MFPSASGAHGMFPSLSALGQWVNRLKIHGAYIKCEVELVTHIVPLLTSEMFIERSVRGAY